MTDKLWLKWGTFKGCDLKSEAAIAAKKKYNDSGKHSASAMMQNDTPEMKAALCELIDAINGEIRNDWDGGTMTKDAAKKYVLGYAL